MDFIRWLFTSLVIAVSSVLGIQTETTAPPIDQDMYKPVVQENLEDTQVQKTQFAPTKSNSIITPAATPKKSEVSNPATVVNPQLPTATLRATQTTISVLGQSSTLSWESNNARYCELNATDSFGNGGRVGTGLTGSKTISPGQTTSYALTCSTGDGKTSDVTKKVTITVSTPTTPTFAFSGSPLTIRAGESATLSWSSTNMDYCALFSLTPTEPFEQTESLVELSGTNIVSPLRTTLYNLICEKNAPGTDKGEVRMEKSVTITVQ